MKFKKEIKAAIIVLSGLAAFIWGFNFLKGNNLFSTRRTFYAVYDQLDGLQNGNPVVIKGFKVGQVGDIHFMDDGSGRLIVKLTVDADVKIPRNSSARIGNSDLLGSKNIQIILKNALQMAQNGDTLYSDNQASLSDQLSSQIKPIKDKAESLLATSDSILTSIQYVFNKNTRDNLASTFASIERTFRSLEHSSYALDTLVYTQQLKLRTIVGNVESISTNLKNNNERISKIFHNISSISDSLVKTSFSVTIRNANAVLNNMTLITDKINKGKGSLGLLINNDSLYRNLNASSADLDKLILDIHENPGRYLTFSVFGGKSEKSKKAKDKGSVSK
jgi:phospholipid/cholesterol/gamma-HCH transport system substrate-binding protein